MLTPARNEASATVSSSPQAMKRVTPSSKLSARLKAIVSSDSDMIDIDHVMNIVVLQNDLLVSDDRLVPRGIQCVEGRSEISVHRLVAETTGDPVEPDPADSLGLLHDLDIADVVRRPRLRQAGGARPVGLDAEDPVFQAASMGVVNQRNLGLRIGGQGFVIVPRRHPEFRVR